MWLAHPTIHEQIHDRVLSLVVLLRSTCLHTRKATLQCGCVNDSRSCTNTLPLVETLWMLGRCTDSGKATWDWRLGLRSVPDLLNQVVKGWRTGGVGSYVGELGVSQFIPWDKLQMFSYAFGFMGILVCVECDSARWHDFQIMQVVSQRFCELVMHFILYRCHFLQLKWRLRPYL